MSDLKVREKKIKEKRTKTLFPQFIQEFGSWYPLMFYRNKGIISKFPDTKRIKVTSLEEYNKDRDTFCDYGIDFDTNKSFFEQFQNVYINTPSSSVLHVGNNENCQFCETAVHVKDAYLSSIVSHSSEKVFYSDVVREHCTNVFNSCYIQYNSDNIYNSFGVDTSFNIFYSRFIRNSNNIWFSTNLIGCSECIFCDGLQNQKYCIKNKELTKDEYLKQKKDILSKKSDFLNWYKNLINVKGINYNSKNVIGSYIVESENVENGFTVTSLKNARNVFLCGSAEIVENIYDHFLGGVIKSNIVGVINSGGRSENIFLSMNIGFSSNIYYSMYLDSCSFCFGCVNLKNKHFCILNKQYEKEDWYKKVDEIFSQMEKNGNLGDFFPGYLNPFYFNDTFGGLLSKNINKDNILKKGYLWRDEKIKTDIPEGAEVVYLSSTIANEVNQDNIINNQEKKITYDGKRFLDDYQGYDENGNWYINSDILKAVIINEKGDFYRILPIELSFLQKYSLPLPEIHWIDRRKLHFNF